LERHAREGRELAVEERARRHDEWPMQKQKKSSFVVVVVVVGEQ
jgi:hypothetical protein